MANTKFQVKRTSVSGRTPNTSDPANTSYIAPGEFALNLADGILYTSNGALIPVGSNQTEVNADQGNFNNIATDGGIAIGNSTVNASINSTALFAGNNSTNVVVNTTILSVSNPDSNSTIRPSSISVGNSTTNTSFSVNTGVTDLYINAYAYDATTKTLTLTTNAAHGITGPFRGRYVTLSNLPAEVSNLNGNREVTSAPTGNSFTVAAQLTSDISKVSRTAGVATITTAGSHGFSSSQTIRIDGVGGLPTLPSVTFDGSITVLSSPAPTSTTFSYTNNPRVDSTAASFFIDAIGRTTTVVTSSAHNYSDKTPLSTTVALAGSVNSNIIAILSPAISSVSGAGFTAGDTIIVTNDTFANKFSSGIPSNNLAITSVSQKLDFKTAGNPIIQGFTARNSSTTLASSTFYISTTAPHGLNTGTKVTIEGGASAFNGDRTVTRRTETEFSVIGGSSLKLSSTSYASANVIINAPANLGWNASNKSIVTYPSISSTVAKISTPTTTAWGALPKVAVGLRSATRTGSTVRITYAASTSQIFAVDDHILLIISLTTGKNYLYNIGANPAAPSTGCFGGFYKITNVGGSSGNYWFEITLSATNQTNWGIITSYTFSTSIISDRIEPFLKLGSTTEIFHNHTSSYSSSLLTYINTTAFSIPTTSLITANLGSSSSLVTASTGTFRFNTDVAEFSPAKGTAGISTITTTDTTANAIYEIVPFVSVANSADSIRITPSTFYTGNSSANLFADPTRLDISTQSSLFRANSTELGIRSATSGVANNELPLFVANNSVLYLGYAASTSAGSPGKKFFRAEAGKIDVFGSELIVGTEVENTSISNAYLTLSSNSYTTYITSGEASFAGDVNIEGSISIANSYGSPGQVIATDGTSTFWSDPNYFDPSSLTEFSNSVVIQENNLQVIGDTSAINVLDTLDNSTIVDPTSIQIIANNNVATVALANNFSITSNTANSSTADTVAANTTVISIGNSSVNATVNSTIFTGAANNTSFVGSVSAANVVSNAQLSANLSNYQTTAGLAANVATLAANSATYLGSSINSGNSTGIYSTGVVTANGIVSGLELTSTQSSGDEGGQINLAAPANTILAGGITIDAYQNKLRIFEQGGNARGAYIDLTGCANGVGTNLLAGAGSGTVTSVDSANGIAGGPITGSGTLYAVAGNTTIFVNSSGIHVNTSALPAASVNLDSQYVWTNTHTFTNTVFLNAVSANGSLGSAGQLLTSNGSDTYWSTVTSTSAPRVNSATSTATLAWDSSSYDQYQLTAMAANTTVSADSAGSINNGQRIIFRFKDDGTARGISWTTGSSNSFRPVGVTLPNTTVISKTLYVGGIYNSADSRWDVIAVAQES